MTNNPFTPDASVQAPNTSMPMPGASTGTSMGGTAADNFEVDLTGVTTNGFIIPDGNYEVICTEVEQTVSKGGNPMFVWTFQIASGDHAGFESKVFTAITPAAMWKVAETVEALGVGQTGSVVKFKRTDVLNKHCGAIFEQTEYNGNLRSQISKVISLQELQASNS